ncbi:MAG: hypothetical protein ABSF55_01510 [Candidatus Staskawiczbacteria bacterium]|jgi:phosphoglycerol transferase MdoB-like AlkP superfamily enzyme
MNKNKLALISLGILLLPALALADTPAPINHIPDLTSVVTSIENAVWIVFGLIAVICFIYAAVLFLTAGGTPEKVQAARSAFLWGVAGVAVGIIAYSIVAIVSSVI